MLEFKRNDQWTFEGLYVPTNDAKHPFREATQDDFASIDPQEVRARPVRMSTDGLSIEQLAKMAPLVEGLANDSTSSLFACVAKPSGDSGFIPAHEIDAKIDSPMKGNAFRQARAAINEIFPTLIADN